MEVPTAFHANHHRLLKPLHRLKSIPHGGGVPNASLERGDWFYTVAMALEDGIALLSTDVYPSVASGLGDTTAARGETAFTCPACKAHRVSTHPSHTRVA